MYIIRKSFELIYDMVKPIIFAATKNDPEKAHEIFIFFCETLYKARLDKAFFDYPLNTEFKKFEFSNAAGFNKNAEIPPSILHYLGFNRAVIGTVIYEPYAGNPRPRCRRYAYSKSIVNQMGLPSEGAQRIAERIAEYKISPIPLSINIAATPKKKGDEMIDDLLSTIKIMNKIKKVDRFELNISCPNISDSLEYEISTIDEVLNAIYSYTENKELFLKISPDVTVKYAKEIILTALKYRITGFIISNTTKKHIKKYIYESLSTGGASGHAVYNYSNNTQKLFEKIIIHKKL